MAKFVAYHDVFISYKNEGRWVPGFAYIEGVGTVAFCAFHDNEVEIKDFIWAVVCIILPIGFFVQWRGTFLYIRPDLFVCGSMHVSLKHWPGTRKCKQLFLYKNLVKIQKAHSIVAIIFIIVIIYTLVTKKCIWCLSCFNYPLCFAVFCLWMRTGIVNQALFKELSLNEVPIRRQNGTKTVVVLCTGACVPVWRYLTKMASVNAFWLFSALMIEAHI